MTKPRIVCLCGSTKFKDDYLLHQKLFTLQGYIVLTVGFFGHHDIPIDQAVKDMLDELHLYKIDLADIVFIINPDGYIGESTKEEIAYAIKKDKPIYYMVV